MYDEPKKRCKELDMIVKEGKLTDEYPLLGYVFSIKDSLVFKDTPSTAGFAINVNNRDFFQENPDAIKNLINKGAIFISKGNVP